MNNETIGKSLETGRINMDFTKEQLSQEIRNMGLSLSSEEIEAIEKGERNMHVVEWSALLSVLGLNPMDVLEDNKDSLVDVFEKNMILTGEDKCFLEDLEMMASAIIKQETL